MPGPDPETLSDEALRRKVLDGVEELQYLDEEACRTRSQITRLIAESETQQESIGAVMAQLTQLIEEQNRRRNGN